MTISNLQTLTKSEFDVAFRAFMVTAEGNETLPYYDTKGHPTIGIGFNLDTMSGAVFGAMGIPDSMQKTLSDILNDSGRRTRALAAANNQTELNKINKEMQDALDVAYKKSFSMTSDQINTLFAAEAATRVEAVKTSSGVDYSNELIALVSLEYNGVYGQGTIDALHLADPNDARAETWYQIRYVHVAGQNESRRNTEADLFNLYGQGRGQLMSEEIARATYRMYTRHEVAMKTRDGEFVLSVQLQPAASYLIDKYGEGKSFDAVNIFVSESNDSPILGGYGVDGGYLDRSADAKDVLLIGGDKSDVFHGGTKNDVLQGGVGMDILYGEGGDDTLVGGKDADTLTGGTGNDTLKGGSGSDTYIYATGDGHDTIYDYMNDGFGGDGSGGIKYDGDGLSGGIGGDDTGEVKKAEHGGTFKSSDKKHTYSWGGPGSDLTIDGNITVKNFENGKLGITLYERKKKPDVPPTIPEQIATWVSAATRAIQIFYRCDPLTLDLNGNGIETVPLKQPPLLFDLNANGIKISTGWIAPSDGLLVLDRNGNGSIDSGAELFGDATPAYVAGTTNPASTGSARTADGFAALAQEDSNHDGVVNNLDTNWNNLRVWQDLNQDGISQANELTTLDQQGIASFNVARTAHSQMLPSGNQMADLGTYTRTDGTTGNTGAPQSMADINLVIDTFHRSFADTIPLTAAAQTLPDMQGSGKVRDLQQAASLQTAAGQALATALANFSAAATREEQLAQLDTLLADWADTAEFGTMQSRAAAHGYTLISSLGGVWQRRLTTLETFVGHGFFKMPWDGASVVESGLQGLSFGRQVYDPATRTYTWNPKIINANFWGAQLTPLDQAYTALRESVYQALLPQTRLKPYLDAIGYSVDANGLHMDFSAVQAAFTDTAAANPAKAVADLIEFNRYGKDKFAGTAWQTDGWQMLGDMLNSTTITPAIQKTLADFNIGMDGHPEQIVKAGQDQVLIASDLGSTLNGSYYNDVLVGRAGDDTLNGGSGNDTLQGGKGNDTLSGGYGNDTYLYNRGDGADSIVDSNQGWWSAETNTLQFGKGITTADIVVRYDSTLQSVVLDMGNGDSIDIGRPVVDGYLRSLSIQQLKFADGTTISTDVLLKQRGLLQVGTDGADTLQGVASYEYGDVLIGGVGNDTLNGGVGNDTYVYNLGDGVDTIIDSGNYYANNTLKFGAGIVAAMLTPSFDSLTQTAVLMLPDGGRIDVGDPSNLSIQTLQFADGSTLAVNTLFVQQMLEQKGTELADTLNGSDSILFSDHLLGLGGDDVLSGGAGSDVLEGGLGNDVLKGGAGNDTYVYNLGDGADTIIDSSGRQFYWQFGDQNTLSFGAGITAIMLTPRFDSVNQTVVLDLGNGDSIDVGSPNDPSIQILKFADGTTQMLDQLLELKGLTVEGTSGADTLTGSNSKYVNYIIGGAGNDVLKGGSGVDTYVFNLGDGADTIIDNSDWNFLQLGHGITPDMILPRLDGVTGEIRLDFGGGDSISVGHYNVSQSDLKLPIQKISFADGTTVQLYNLLTNKGFLVEGNVSDEVLNGAMSNQNRMFGFNGNDTLIGGQRDDTLDGGAGNDVLDAGYGNDVLTGGLGDDTLIGGEGNDVYVYNLGDGSDVINDTMQRGQVNTLRLGAGANIQSIEYQGRATGDLLLHFADGGSLRITGVTADNAAVTCAIQRFELADGSVLSAQQLFSQFAIDVVGTDGYWWNPKLGSDVLNGTNLNDRISGLGGNDVLLGGEGDDVLDGGVGNDTLSGDAGNDTLLGGDGNDMLYGREGNDVLVGGLGNDVLQGGTGNDTYVFALGDGEDRIIDSSGSDVLSLGQGIARGDLSFSKAGVNLRIALPNGTDAVVLEDWFTGNTTVNTLQFADGSTFDLLSIAQSVVDQPVIGTPGNDTLLGSIYNDTLQGGQGNDTLIGGTGDDVYRFNVGDGVDQIYELSAMAAVKGNDVIEFGAGITPDMLRMDLQAVSAAAHWQPSAFPNQNADLLANKSGIERAEDQFIHDAKSGIINSYLSQGYTQQADGSLYRQNLGGAYTRWCREAANDADYAAHAEWREVA